MWVSRKRFEALEQKAAQTERLLLLMDRKVVVPTTAPYRGNHPYSWGPYGEQTFVLLPLGDVVNRLVKDSDLKAHPPTPARDARLA